jgi:NADH-ubiquinone oxidoreductase chain 2
MQNDEINKKSNSIDTNVDTEKKGEIDSVYSKSSSNSNINLKLDTTNNDYELTNNKLEKNYNKFNSAKIDNVESKNYVDKLSGNTSIGENPNLQDINNSPIQLISQLKGYYYVNPMLSLSLSITLFSFIGIPPLIGFFGKQMILSSALDSGYVFMSLVAILTSVISAVYYLVIIKQMFFDKPDYILNPQLKDFSLRGLIVEKDRIVEKVNITIPRIVISSSLSLPISILTLIIELFIFIPQE